MQLLERVASSSDALRSDAVPTSDASPPSDAALLRDMDAAHLQACRAQRRLLSFIAEADRRSLWKPEGAHDMAHWLWMRYGLSGWKARRWVQAAHGLESLPLVSEAFCSGSLGIDKVVELCRFATPETEGDLLPWATRVSAGAIRARADREARTSLEETAQRHESRSLSWWHEDEGRELCLEGRLPAAAGEVVTRALERLAGKVPVTPGGGSSTTPEQRRADALVALCSSRIASDPDQDRATVVVHVPVEALGRPQQQAGGPQPAGMALHSDPERGCELEGGGVIHPATARRLACDARIETVLEDRSGWVLGLGRSSREPSAQMLRALRRRDSGCRFPGCGSRRFTAAHHVWWWSLGGPTDLANLVLLCSFHHTLVHENGWRLELARDGRVRWYRPDGRRYRAGPAPLTTRESRGP